MIISPPFDSYIITQAFAENPHAYTQFGYPGHNGIDLWTNQAPPLVLCVFQGVVEKVGWEEGGYGKYIVVLHSGAVNWRSYYAHLKTVHVKPGEMITTNQPIAEMGSTGNSTGPHLHLGIRFPVSFNPPFKGFIDPYPLLQQASLPVAPLVNPPLVPTQEGYVPAPAGTGGVLHVTNKPKPKPKLNLPGSVLVGTWRNKTIFRMKKYY